MYVRHTVAVGEAVAVVAVVTILVIIICLRPPCARQGGKAFAIIISPGHRSAPTRSLGRPDPVSAAPTVQGANGDSDRACGGPVPRADRGAQRGTAEALTRPRAPCCAAGPRADPPAPALRPLHQPRREPLEALGLPGPPAGRWSASLILV